MKTNKKFLLFIALGLAIIVVAGVCLKASGNYVVHTANTSKKKLPVYGVKRDDDSLSISFDCAWGVEYTDGILDALDFYGVKATFFVVPFWAEKYPDYLKKISEDEQAFGKGDRGRAYKLGESYRGDYGQESNSFPSAVRGL